MIIYTFWMYSDDTFVGFLREVFALDETHILISEVLGQISLTFCLANMMVMILFVISLLTAI